MDLEEDDAIKASIRAGSNGSKQKYRSCASCHISESAREADVHLW